MFYREDNRLSYGTALFHSCMGANRLSRDELLCNTIRQILTGLYPSLNEVIDNKAEEAEEAEEAQVWILSLASVQILQCLSGRDIMPSALPSSKKTQAAQHLPARASKFLHNGCYWRGCEHLNHNSISKAALRFHEVHRRRSNVHS